MNMTADKDVIIYHDEQTIIQMIEKHPAGKGATKLKRIDRWRNAASAFSLTPSERMESSLYLSQHHDANWSS